MVLIFEFYLGTCASRVFPSKFQDFSFIPQEKQTKSTIQTGKGSWWSQKDKGRARVYKFSGQFLVLQVGNSTRSKHLIYRVNGSSLPRPPWPCPPFPSPAFFCSCSFVFLFCEFCFLLLVVVVLVCTYLGTFGMVLVLYLPTWIIINYNQIPTFIIIIPIYLPT